MLSNKLVVIAGGGYFGTRAISLCKRSLAKAVVLDTNPSCKASKHVDKIIKGIDFNEIPNIKPGSAVLFICDATEFLIKLLEFGIPDYIVPAIPGNLMGWVTKKWLEDRNFFIKSDQEVANKIAESIPKGLLLDYDENSATIITSYMPKGKLCKSLCNQPTNSCPVTHRPKIGSMYRILTNLTQRSADYSWLMYSRNLGGVGGFKGIEFASFISGLEGSRIHCSLAVGIACDCHGILNVFRLVRSDKTVLR